MPDKVNAQLYRSTVQSLTGCVYIFCMYDYHITIML